MALISNVILSTQGAREVLRRRTRADHDAVDQVYSRFDLGDASGYRRFLRAQAACVIPLEAAVEARAAKILQDWPSRRRAALVLADLRELGDEPQPSGPVFRFDSDAEALGAVYVLEGSRLGGAVLARQVYPDAPLRFLSPPAAKGSWRSFVDLLDRRLGDEAGQEAALDAARSVFKRFEAAGRRELEGGLVDQA